MADVLTGEDLEQFKVPGASWALIDDGVFAEQGSLGVAEAGGTTPITTGTLFQACSISKPVAVFAMLRLVDRGLLDLDDDVNRWLTSWQIPPTGEWRPVVTLRQLASHTAGLTVPGFPGYKRGAELPTPVEILNGVNPTNTFGVRVDLVPGTLFRYSGGGTVVLQQLLEDVTGTPFRQLARELVFEPLGMSDSDFAQPLPPELQDRAATAHDELGRPVEGRWHSYPELAAAGLWTTPTDLVAFALGIKSAYVGAAGALVSQELAREMLTPQIPMVDPYDGMDALGLGVFLADGGARFGHGGSNKGFKCHLVAYRDTGQGAAVMTNGDGGTHVVEKVLTRMAASYGWQGYPRELIERADADETALKRLTGRYQLRENVYFEVAGADGGLEVVFDRQPALRFGPRGKGRFGARWGVDAELRLTGDGGLVFVQDGVEVECSRLA
ncbi:serine hydrolase domain-containing protein [Kribbella sp. NPDC023855]|uniref:serine hydrolase domain-containing protein n=1 Tax=Kribbella sp. NPDC023855 TaxID=3154698 RepID=UPI0033F9AAE1